VLRCAVSVTLLIAWPVGCICVLACTCPAKCRRRVLVRVRQPLKGEILNHRRVRACKALNGFASNCERVSMSLCACRFDRL
jgi:hypothetical protein